MTGQPDQPGHAVAAACGAIAIWSTNAVAGGAALAHLTVLQVLALQFGGAFLVLAAVRTRRRDGAAEPGSLGPRAITVGVVGLTGTIVLQYLAFATAPLVAANAIAYAWPLLTAVWAAFAPGTRGSRMSLALAVVGFGGVLLLFAARGDPGSSESAPLLGYVAALGSAVTMAGYTLTAGRSGARTGDLLLVGTGAGALGTVPAALLEGSPWSPGWAVALGLGIGVAVMAAGYALWTRAMAHPAGARLAPAAYATPLLSTGLLLATGQRLSPLGLLGCALIVLCAGGVVLDAFQWEESPRVRPA
ncbi:MAG: DMT family transporter [Actinomycetota bacterium]|nr:DMT family transporter [Actinomycetota bacterium]